MGILVLKYVNLDSKQNIWSCLFHTHRRKNTIYNKGILSGSSKYIPKICFTET